jgi:hypothetical protein
MMPLAKGGKFSMAMEWMRMAAWDSVKLPVGK